MKLPAERGLFVAISVFALLLLVESVTSRGVTSGGGPAGNSSGSGTSGGREGYGFGARPSRSGSSENSSGSGTSGGREGYGFGARPSRSGSRENSGIAESPPLHAVHPHQSKATGAYLIPGGGSYVLPIYPHPQEVKSYYKREGSGMSAWGIIALILGIIGGGTVAWFCYMVGLPMWRDRRRRHSLKMSESMRRPGHEGIPLQETPSTATPSPCIAVCLPS